MRPQISSTCIGLMLASQLCGCGGRGEAAYKAGDASTCSAVELPLSSASEGPTLSRLVLTCETGGQLVPEIIVSDPQGDADLDDVPQLLEVYERQDCTGSVVVFQDDVGASGEIEWFGTEQTDTDEQQLFQTICSQAAWPVKVRIRDASGHEVTGVINAEVVRS